MRKLSYSQITKYNTCPRSYKLHYIDKWREKSATSFLSFGSAVDSALNAVFKDFKEKKEITIDYKAIFDKHWETITINKKTHNLMDCALVGYAKSDFVAELLTDQDLVLIKDKTLEFAPELKDMDAKELRDHLESRRSQRAYVAFKESEQRLLNVINWLSLKRKAHLMLDAYIKEIIPKFDEIIEYQYKVELESEKKGFIGYVDLIVKFKGEETYTIIDNKTSGSPYNQEDVNFSQQLATYAFATGIHRAGYAVMLKNIKMNKVKVCKKCNFTGEGRHKTCNNEVNGARCGGEWGETVVPEALVQLFTDNIPLDKQQMIADNIGEVNDAIEAGCFPKNLSACQNVFGNPCPYIKYCWEGKTDNLVKLGEEDER